MELSQPEKQDNAPIVRVHWRWLDLLLMLIVGIIVLFAGQLALGIVNRQLQGNFFAAFIAPLELLWEVIVLVSTVYLLGLCRTHQSWAAIGLRPVPWIWVGGALALDLCALPLVGMVSVLVRVMLKQPLTGSPSPMLTHTHYSLLSVGLTILIGGLLGPFAEELFFRGVIYNFLRERWGMWAGAFGSAFVFAVAHFSISNATSAFVIGIFFAVAYERSKSLWTSVLMHAAFDTTILLLFYLTARSFTT